VAFDEFAERDRIGSRTLPQRQCSLDGVIARESAPERERTIERCLGMPRSHVGVPAFALRAVGWQQRDIRSLAQRRRRRLANAC
jgi:hypothetical protein